MSRIQKFRMFNAGNNSALPSNNMFASRSIGGYSQPSFMPRMGYGYNRMNTVDSPVTMQRASTTSVKPATPTKTQILGTGKSKRSITGESFNVPVKKRVNSKKTKEPLCDCGMPISQCQCDGHDHKVKNKKSTRTSSVKKSAPPDYLTIYGNAIQEYANRLNSNQRKYMPPPLYPQTFGATVHIGDDGGLSGYTSLYNSQRGSRGSTMRKSMCKCGSGMRKGMCKCGSGMSKNFAKAKVSSRMSRRRPMRPSMTISKPKADLLTSLLMNPQVTQANRFTTQVAIPAVQRFGTQVVIPAAQRAIQASGPMARNAGRRASIALYRTKKSTGKAVNRLLNSAGSVVDAKVKPAFSQFVQSNINPTVDRILDASLKDIAMAPVMATKTVISGVRQIPSAIMSLPRKTRNAVIAGKLYGRQFMDDVVGSRKGKPNKAALAIVGRKPENNMSRKLQNMMIAGKLYGKDYATDIGNMSLRDALKPVGAMSRNAVDRYKKLTPKQKKALWAGVGLTGAGAYAYDQFNKRSTMKKSITPMGGHVVGGYHGKSISKAMKSSQTNLSGKYM